MANDKSIIMDDGEPYVHMQTLIAHIGDNIDHASPALVPGMLSVIEFLSVTHDTVVLSDRKD